MRRQEIWIYTLCCAQTRRPTGVIVMQYGCYRNRNSSGDVRERWAPIRTSKSRTTQEKTRAPHVVCLGPFLFKSADGILPTPRVGIASIGRFCAVSSHKVRPLRSGYIYTVLTGSSVIGHLHLGCASRPGSPFRSLLRSTPGALQVCSSSRP